MYRIQAYNLTAKRFDVLWTDCMVKRMQIVKDLLATGEYADAGITIEWLPHMSRGH